MSYKKSMITLQRYYYPRLNAGEGKFVSKHLHYGSKRLGDTLDVTRVKSRHAHPAAGNQINNPV